MPNNNYRRGYALERAVKKLLETRGYTATRAAGSHGLYDVWATNGKHLLLVQCKIGASQAYAEKLAKEMLHEFLVLANPPIVPAVFIVVSRILKGELVELARTEYVPERN